MQNNKILDFLRENIVQVSIFLFSAAVSVMGLVLLPEKIYVQLFSERSFPETETVFFLLAAFFLVGLAGLMSIITEDKKKWLGVEGVLAIAEAVTIVYNLILI